MPLKVSKSHTMPTLQSSNLCSVSISKFLDKNIFMASSNPDCHPVTYKKSSSSGPTPPVPCKRTSSMRTAPIHHSYEYMEGLGAPKPAPQNDGVDNYYEMHNPGDDDQHEDYEVPKNIELSDSDDNYSNM